MEGVGVKHDLCESSSEESFLIYKVQLVWWALYSQVLLQGTGYWELPRISFLMMINVYPL